MILEVLDHPVQRDLPASRDQDHQEALDRRDRLEELVHLDLPGHQELLVVDFVNLGSTRSF